MNDAKKIAIWAGTVLIVTAVVVGVLLGVNPLWIVVNLCVAPFYALGIYKIVRKIK